MDGIVQAGEKSREPPKLLRHLGFAWQAGADELGKRFQTSMLGGLWLIVGPALLMLVYWVVFDRVLGVKFTNPTTGNGVPFLAAFAVGFFNYMTFSELVGQATNWFTSKRRIVTETSLPLWVAFGILVSKAFIQYVCYLALTIAICTAYGLTDIAGSMLFLVAALPVFALFCGVALIAALLAPYFPDVKEIVPLLVRMQFYVSSITFPLASIPETWRWLPMINPLTWAVELNRDLLLWGHGGSLPFAAGLAMAFVVVWAIAVFLYIRLVRSMAEVV
jgi:lipopolysaccharide transport system permease protein